MKKLIPIIIIVTLIVPFLITPISFAYDTITSTNEQTHKENVNVIEDSENSNKNENETGNTTNEEENKTETEEANKEENENIENSVSEEGTENEGSENKIPEEDITIKDEVPEEETKIENEVKSEIKSTELEEGIYYIKTLIDEKEVLDVMDNSKENGASIQLWEKSAQNTDNQKFEITKTESGNYTIKAMHSGKVLEEKEGSKVQQYEINNKETQEWIINKTADGYYNIISKSTGLYLDIPGAMATDGRVVRLYEGNESNAQKFELEKIEELANEKTIEDGTYYIKSAVNTSEVFDVTGNSYSNGANIQLWEKSVQSTDNQKFEVKYLSDGYYEIKAKHSGKVLDVAGAGTTNGTRIQQYDSNESDAQKWIIKEAGDGYYNIISKCNGLYIDIPGGIVTDGSSVQMYEGNGSTAQKFKLEKIEELVSEKTIEDGTYYIKSAVNTNEVFDVTGNSYSNGANIQLWEKSAQSTDNQKFEVKYLSDGYYEIKAKHSGKVLDVAGAGTTNGTRIQQYDSNESDAQKWIIKEAGDGYYNIISKCNGLYIDIPGGIVTDGSNVQMYEGNGSNAQKFEFEKIQELVGEKIIEDGKYKIKAGTNETLGFDVESNSKESGANVQIWKESELISKNQRFEIEYSEEGYYTIVAMHSNKVLDVIDGTNLKQNDANGGKSQQWIIRENSDGTYSIISRLNGLYLTMEAIAEGSKIKLSNENESENQKFKFQKIEQEKSEKLIEDGVYTISTALNPNSVFDIAEASYKDGANLQLWTSTGVQQQKFEIKYIEEGYYEIKSANSGKMLDVAGGVDENGTNVRQYESNGTEYQKWILQDAGNGYYYIISRGAESYLDVAGDIGEEGANIQIYEADGTAAQQFKFEKTPIIVGNKNYNISTGISENKVLDIDLATSNLQIWTLNEQSNNQKFKLEYLEDGYYKITCKATNQALTVVEGFNVIQSEYVESDNQKWVIEVAQNGYYYIKSKETGLYLDVAGASTVDGTNVRVYDGNKTNSQMFKFNEVSNSNESNFSEIDESRYPGYKEALEELQSKHPNWILTLQYTGLDWNTVLDAQDQFASNNQPKSLTQYGNEWKNGDEEYGTGWYRASREAIAYMMDPRNSLSEGYIFQFQDLTSSVGTYEDILKMIEGTFLTKYEDYSTESIINAILSAATTYNVSPYHLTSRMLQEQGKDGTSSLAQGYEYNGRKVYNLFNISATGSTDQEILENGAKYAYEHHWLTPEACILGSASFLNTGYLSVGQTTLYFQKYNVVSEPLYENQYMQNIRAANDEGNIISNEYKENGMINGEFEFVIPVYENMPVAPAPRPAA